MGLTLSLAVLAGVALAEPAIEAHVIPEIMTFSEWRAHFEKEGALFSSHKTLEERETQFNRNIEKIKQQNAMNDAGLSGFRFGVNQFADLTPDEFGKAVGLGNPRPERTTPRNEKKQTNTAADSIDWRTLGAVSEVKNQGQCGSCWSFSTTGAIEGDVKVEAGTLISLSEKQLVDCSRRNSGCQGGLMDLGFQYVINNGGIDSESDYPYEPENGSCQTTKAAKHVATITGFTDVTPNNVNELLAAVTQQPVAIAIEADKTVFQLYTSGVLDSASCGTQLDHGVLIVGFTKTNDPQFPNAWIVKNSWGPAWGQQGYIYISRITRYSAAGICGILSDPSYPTGGAVGPAPGPGPSPSPAPSSDMYENPFRVSACKTGEVNVTVGNPSGSICAPTCSGPTDTSCPSAPSGCSATPGCNLVDTMISAHFCSLTCNPYGSDQACQDGAECDVFCDSNSCNWMCLYKINRGNSTVKVPALPTPTSGLHRLHQLQYDDM